MRRLLTKDLKRASRKERGIAILVVLITIALLTAIVVEFQYSATVDLQLAYNARDELQAEYNALTAMPIDGHEIENLDPSNTPIVIPDIAPAPAAYNGQFVEMDVVSVASL